MSQLETNYICQTKFFSVFNLLHFGGTETVPKIVENILVSVYFDFRTRNYQKLLANFLSLKFASTGF